MKKILAGSYSSVSKTSITILLTVGFLFSIMPSYHFDPFYLPSMVRAAIPALLLFMLVLVHHKLKFPPIIMLLILIMLLGLVAIFNKGVTSTTDILATFRLVISVIFLAVLFSMSKQLLLSIYNKFVLLFVFLNAPSLVYWLIIFLGVDVSYELINLGGRGFMYRNYQFLAIFTDYTIYSFGNIHFARLCGIYEEPGSLGTYAGLLLALDFLLFPNRVKIKLFLLIFGLLSLSLAFYMFLFFIGLYVVRKNRRHIVTLLATIIILLTVAGDVLYERIAQRFHYDAATGTITGNNRSQYDIKYNEYFNSAPELELLVGNGPLSNKEARASYSSYHKILYEHGIIGALIFATFFFYFIFYLPVVKKKNLSNIFLTIVPLLSVYQRPEVLGAYYMLLYALVYKGCYIGNKDDDANKKYKDRVKLRKKLVPIVSEN